MSPKYISLFTLLILSFHSGCEPSGRNTGPSGAAEQTQQHAHAGAKPGSHEDWCGEHQVPESLCTRCNASLVPAFKATNDWCPAHKLPESQCFACNPGLKIVRPPPTPAGP